MTRISRTLLLVAPLLVCIGCVVEDTTGRRGQPHEPSATIPDSGSPIRRESAAETLREADPEPPADATLEVKPPPVQ